MHDVYSLNYPAYLYKYLGDDRINFFEQNCGLRFSQRSSFNDPFEQLQSNRTQLESFTEEERRALFSVCANDFNHSPSLVRHFIKNKISHEKNNESPDYTSGGGLLCLSETPDNILMWSHYGSDHRGIAIEIDSQYFFERQLYKKTGNFIIRRVIYRDSRFEDQGLGLHEYLFGTPHDTISTKSRLWSYENEWRIESYFDDDQFFRVKDNRGNFSKDKNDNEYFIHKIPEKYITKIIFGANCKFENILQINHQLKQTSLNHIKMKLAVLDPVDFKIRLINIKPEDLSEYEVKKNAA